MLGQLAPARHAKLQVHTLQVVVDSPSGQEEAFGDLAAASPFCGQQGHFPLAERELHSIVRAHKRRRPGISAGAGQVLGAGAGRGRTPVQPAFEGEALLEHTSRAAPDRPLSIAPSGR
jgi:hypothetical protein